MTKFISYILIRKITMIGVDTYSGKSAKMVMAEAERVSHRGRSSTKRWQTCYAECAALIFHKVQDPHSKASQFAIFCSTCRSDM
jgi:hypothetical protein